MRTFLVAAALTLGSQANAASITMPFQGNWMNTDAPGAVYKSEDHPKGVFVLEFFANFCGACNENAENVDELASHYQGEERVQVIDMGTDSSDREIQRWIATHQPNHPVVKDVNRTVWRQVGSQYIPTAIVVDCHGEIQFKYVGVWDESVKRDLQSKIDGLLAQNDCGQ